jgi:hypothetical protein
MTDDEHRIAKRHKVLKSAKLIFDKNKAVFDCSVKDISATGAKLLVKSSFSIPDDVRFLLTQDNTIRDAKVVWRKGDQIGVHFLSDAVRAPARKFATS